MIPTNKSEHKHLRIEGTKCTQNEINTTMKASIHSEVRFSTKWGRKSTPMEQGNEKQSGRMICPETLELIYMSPSGLGK
jgi:hypothetical protein